MKLASYKSGRDGHLMVVNDDLTTAVSAADIAPNLQSALDDWDRIAPLLQKRSQELQSGTAEGIVDFDPAACASPLPRAYQWLDGSAYINHIELVRKARGAQMPENIMTDPLMYQGGSDSFLAPQEDIRFITEEYGVDFEGEVVIITGDVPMGVSAADAGKYIRLVMLVNDISLRFVAQTELNKGFGFMLAKPSSAFSPVAVTPDNLGTDWQNYKLHRPIIVQWNDKTFGTPDAGVDMAFNFAELIAHAAKTRPLCAGTIIGSGTISNKDRSKGHACIIEKRMVEKIEGGKSTTPFMAFGDTVRIEMFDDKDNSIFGAIDQKFTRA